jgi:hypothetical protein
MQFPEGAEPALDPPSPSSALTHASRLLRMQRAAKTVLLASTTGNRFARSRRGSSMSLASTLVGVDPEWKARLLEAFARLEQRETHQVGYMELREVLAGELSAEQALTIMGVIRKMTNAKPMATRVSLLRLLSRLVATRSTAALRAMDGIVAFLIERLHDPESAMREACVECTSSVALHLVPLLSLGTTSAREVDFPRLLGPLTSAISEQSPAVQEGAGLCVAALANPTPAPFTLAITSTAKYLDEARQVLKRYSDLPSAAPPPRDMLLLPDGRLLLDFPSVAEARAFFVSRAAVGGLPADWQMEAFPEERARAWGDLWSAYVSCLGYFCPRLLHAILSAMKMRAGLRRPLYTAIRNLATLAATQPDGRLIGKALAVAVAPVVERAISTLKDRKAPGASWRDRAEAAEAVAALARCYECVGPLLEVKQVLASALAQARADTVKAVRDACASASAALNELAAFAPRDSDASTGLTASLAAGTTHVMSARRASMTATAHDLVPGLVAGPEVEPPPHGGDMSLPPGMGGEEGPRRGKSTTAGGGSSSGSSLAETTKSSLAGEIQRAMAGAGEPEPTVAGGPAATVRVLKEIGKSVTKSNTALQRSLQRVSATAWLGVHHTHILPSHLSAGCRVPRQMSAETQNTLSEVVLRIAQLERSVDRTGSPEKPRPKSAIPQEPTTTEAPMPPPQPTQPFGAPAPPSMPPCANMYRPQERAAGGVSLWREVSWLLHCGEVETAFERVLVDGADKDLLRVMAKTGACLSLLTPPTKALLFSALAAMLQHGNDAVVEQALPWVLKGAVSGDALKLPKAIRRDLVKGLYRLVVASAPAPIAAAAPAAAPVPTTAPAPVPAPAPAPAPVQAPAPALTSAPAPAPAPGSARRGSRGKAAKAQDVPAPPAVEGGAAPPSTVVNEAQKASQAAAPVTDA